MRIIDLLAIYKHDFQDYLCGRNIQVHGEFKYINCWHMRKINGERKDLSPDLYWFEKFIRYHFPDMHAKFNFYSVFGHKRFVKKEKGTISVFFSGENISDFQAYKVKSEEFYHRISNRVRMYHDACTSDVDLSLGYSLLQKSNYLRFPSWITIHFKPESNFFGIKKEILKFNLDFASQREKEAVVIASHDNFGIREKICNDISPILEITYAGKWRNNTDDLWKNYDNGKKKYLRQFMFNVCAENMNASGYTTEKIFDAFESGCIPIYYGSDNNPEPDVINPDSVIFWNMNDNNSENLKMIKKLKSDERFYKKFIQQPKLMPYADEWIEAKLRHLEKRIGRLLECNGKR